jgi:hypothetical protein
VGDGAGGVVVAGAGGFVVVAGVDGLVVAAGVDEFVVVAEVDGCSEVLAWSSIALLGNGRSSLACSGPTPTLRNMVRR